VSLSPTQEPGYVVPIGINEKERLAALAALQIVDTAESASFNRICDIAQYCFGVPVVTVTFVEAKRLWFKASIGVDGSCMARDNAFSNYTILQDGAFVVQDTLLDARFVDSPLVVDGPHIRFYAGAPIALRPGLRVGSICLVDQKPHEFSTKDRSMLEKLAAIAVSELRLLMATRAFMVAGRPVAPIL
jgi:GAF domain-containing protein